MSEQSNQSIFDRYSKRRPSHLPEQENRPSLVPLDDGPEDAPTGQETPHSSDSPVLNVESYSPRVYSSIKWYTDEKIDELCILSGWTRAARKLASRSCVASATQSKASVMSDVSDGGFEPK